MESENLVAPGRSRFAVANDDAVRAVAPLDPFDLLPTPTLLLDAAGEIVRVNLAWREDPDLGGALLGGGLRRPYERVVRGPGAASAGALVQRVLRGAARAEEVLPWHGAQRERWLSVEVSRVAGDGALVEHRDATSSQRAARRAMIDARLASTPSPARSEETLRWLCGVMGWSLAAAWTASAQGASLALNLVAADRHLARGWAVIEETRGAVMRAWREGAPVWAAPETRGEMALLRECLRDRSREVQAVLAVPCEGGVVTFYSPHERAPDEALRALLMVRFGRAHSLPAPPRAEVAVRARVTLAALSAAPVLLYGEAHTGKRTLAREIHRLGARAERPLVTVSTDATEERLAGLERWEGDARERTVGLAARARGGVLLIEDLDALSPAAQRWLGEAMSEGRYLPPGASEPHPFEARVIACARCSPEELLARGADPILIDRLGAFTLRVPPLRERRDELPDLAARSLATIARAWGVAPPALSDDAVRAVVVAPWEGNLRELRAVLERAWMGVGRTVTAASLAAARATPTRAAVEPAPASLATSDDDARLAASERAHVERVLRQTDFHISAAARLLGISRSKLYDRVHLWGLDLAAMRAASV